ncbi:MAG: 3,4-dihydroxy 2-butanone 4-phosphate synthase [Candidatus Methanomethylophilaceae archaeon]|nr:3,4-dihydroxy 2-butanone 4-phosphate synthase [Candidatus Methanomethylophilaceae archaeon]MDI3542028.1 3,4-dihydroxy 2-butanone 4-phosphate synthase [Candidatus Methanomethylophilaceae archaeon]HIJ00248.1 3,4-dihydroxy-2-butanone-4-phosphate synthase [Candidatus Methanomethylophilaceae archaeon]
MDTIKKALEDLQKGKIVLVYDFDDRERETDMIMASQFMTHEHIRRMRKDAGGLICTTVYGPVAEELGLPFLTDLLAVAAKEFPSMSGLAPFDIPYDTKSAFSVTINHRDTYTGITDRDRALTISELAKIVGMEDNPEKKREELWKHFRSPGHVHLLRTSNELLKERKGHTEMSTALTLMAGLISSATVCEMMGDDGNALSKAEAKRYADRNDFVFLEGEELIDAWKSY